jgi:hypothetical protein
MSSHEFARVERLAEPLLAAGRAYDYDQTPAHYFSVAEQERTGTNCKVLGHEFTRTVLGIELSTDLQIAEAYFGADDATSPLRRVRPNESLRLGDWILYGRPDAVHPRLVLPRFDNDGNMTNWREFAVNHQGVYLGEHHGQQMILHATPEDAVTISPQREIQRSRRTSVIYDVLRLRNPH